MNSTAVLFPPILKEARVLAVPWLACVLCMALPSMLDAPMLAGLAVTAYFLGAAALGALSVGHEYTGRTLSLFLSLPVRRQRLLAIKLGVLATLLLALSAVAHTLVFGDTRLPQAPKQAASLLPALCGLFLAPWLTMLCRNAVGGAVFTLALPGTLLVIGELAGVKMYGGGPLMNAFRLAFVWYGTLGVCIIGAALTWWKFARLEAIEGPGQEVRLPRWLRRSPARSAAPHLRRYNPVWLLVKKELHLQQLPMALAALLLLSWVAVMSETAPSLAALTFLCAGLIPMLIGSTASAGERQIGTLEWQVLQPIAASKQWAIKVGVVLTLSLALAIGVPVALLAVAGLAGMTVPGSLIAPDPSLLVFITLLTCGSLYVSSVCSSALWALVMSVFSAVGFSIFLNFVMGRVGSRLYFNASAELSQILILGFIAALIGFARTNHRSADRAFGRTWKQVGLLGVYVTASVILLKMQIT